MLTVQIAANPEDQLEETLRSVEPLGAEVQILPRNCPRDTLRNRHVLSAKHDWILWLEPWETLAQGHDELLGSLEKPAAYRLQVVQRTVVAKEVRLWHRATGLSFVNPVCETLKCDDAPLLHGAVVFSNRSREDYLKDWDPLGQWMVKEPLSPEPHYYRACMLLVQGRHKEFLTESQRFLFMQDYGASAVMTRYYMGQVLLYIEGNVKAALIESARCLSACPLMAEFWCLAADCLYFAGQYERAKTIYENSIILGQKRLHADEFPIDVSKYREYPERMMLSCQEARKGVTS